MTTRKPRSRTGAASKAAKTIDLTAEDVTDRNNAEAAKDAVEENAAPKPARSTRSRRTKPASSAAAATASKAEQPKTPASKPDATPASGAKKPVSEEAKLVSQDKVSADKDDTAKEAPKADTKPADKAANVAPAKEESKQAKPEIKKEPIPAAPAPVEAKKGGFGSGLFGGLLGGVAVVALSYVGLQQGMISLPGMDTNKSDQQATQITELTQQLDGLKGQVSELPKVDVSPIETRIADVEAQIASVGEKLAALNDAQSEVVASNSDADPTPTEKTAQASGETDTQTPVTDEGAESAVAASDDADAPVAPTEETAAVDLAPITTEIEALTGKLEGLTQRLEGLEGLNAQFASAREKLNQLEAQALAQTALIESKAVEQAAKLEAELKAAQDSIMSSADRRINDVVTDLSNMSEKIGAEATALVGRVTSLEENNLSEKMQSSARTIALAGLENAVASGANYQLALTTFADVVGKHEAVESLAQSAETGAPTKKQLAGDFRSVYGNVLREAEDAGAATLMDKFLLNAQNLVRVRSLSGEKKGESLSSKLGVIEFHVGKGDLVKAAAEWDSLPEAARDAKAGADWLKGVKTRIAVDAAMETIRAEFGNGATKTAQ